MDQEADEQAMAQMMGFSSFGGPDRPQKKRKYNPHADAAVGKAPRKPASTGANSTALGTRTQASTAVNEDEIDLDDDDGGAGQGPAVEQPTAPSGSSEPSHTTLHQLPQRPVSTNEFTISSVDEPHGQDSRSQGAQWYEGYYDTLSNRNPWEKLEKAMGLQPKGTWLSHNHQAKKPT